MTKRKANALGFGAMPLQLRREIARLGGKAAHQYGKAHEFTSQEAQSAGRKGGMKTRETHGAQFYKEIGRLGGQERAKGMKAVHQYTTLPPTTTARASTQLTSLYIGNPASPIDLHAAQGYRGEYLEVESPQDMSEEDN